MDKDNISVFSQFDRLLHAYQARHTFFISPSSLLLAYADWAVHMANSPGKQYEVMQRFLTKTKKCYDYAIKSPGDGNKPLLCQLPSPGDRRFSGEEWQKWPYSAIYQSFLLFETWWEKATTGVSGVSCHHENVVSFMARQLFDMFSPSNYILTNPEVQKRTREQLGYNLVRGWMNLLDDVKRTVNEEKPAGTEQFRVGKEVATTPGKVILRNRVMELIQYSPTTEKVHAEPVLIVPAWIMKYYILDLSPHNSLVKYLVDKGHTVFMISWLNPGPEDRELGMEDYRTMGVMEAIDAVSKVVPDRKIHAVGYCLGGIIMTIAAAAMAREDDHRLQSLSLLATQTDFTEAGELMIFIDEGQVSYLEDSMWNKGYLDTKQMAGAFQLLRSSELIWARIVRDYLMGESRSMSDLMAWNADATRMPFRMHSQFLRSLFLDNDLVQGRYMVDGRPISLRDINVPVFNVATTKDHVAPWRSVYKFHNFSNSAELTFVLCSGGHNAGIVSEPGHPRRTFRISTRRVGDKYIDPDTWMDVTPEQQGSWWTAWKGWLTDCCSNEMVDPPQMGSPENGLAPVMDAPGTYVLQE